jgi:hypothetical protein
MTDRILNLRPDCLDLPTRLDLSMIEATMLWPDDKSKRERERAIQTSAVAGFFEISQALPKDELIALVSLAADATPLAEVHGRARVRFIDGVRAGLYLRETVGLATLSKNRSMKQIAARVCRGLEPHASSINPHTFENHVWPVYRRVAHFWAASWDLNLEQVLSGSSAFPCSLKQLATFLALAEGYRRLGERTRTRRGTTVLPRSETITLPAWFNLCIEPEFMLKGPPGRNPTVGGNS